MTPSQRYAVAWRAAPLSVVSRPAPRAPAPLCLSPLVPATADRRQLSVCRVGQNRAILRRRRVALLIALRWTVVGITWRYLFLNRVGRENLKRLDIEFCITVCN